MALPTNSEVIQTFIEQVWNKGRIEAIDELYSTGGIAKGVGEEHQQGPEEFKAFAQLMHNTFTDINMVVDDVIESGDKVAFRGHFTGTHKKTGIVVSIEGGGFGIVRNGRIAQAWNNWNFLDLLAQVGTVPPNAFIQLLTAQ